MAKCSFCGYDIERGTGKIKIMKDGKVIPLCGTKCEKNMFKLGRVPRETAWTAEYKAAKAVRLGAKKDTTAKKEIPKKETTEAKSKPKKK